MKKNIQKIEVEFKPIKDNIQLIYLDSRVSSVLKNINDLTRMSSLRTHATD